MHEDQIWLKEGGDIEEDGGEEVGDDEDEDGNDDEVTVEVFEVVWVRFGVSADANLSSPRFGRAGMDAAARTVPLLACSTTEILTMEEVWQGRSVVGRQLLLDQLEEEWGVGIGVQIV